MMAENCRSSSKRAKSRIDDTASHAVQSRQLAGLELHPRREANVAAGEWGEILEDAG